VTIPHPMRQQPSAATPVDHDPISALKDASCT
jgi:hypothetical protein